MRVLASLSLLIALALAGCAYEGVVVEKSARPHPLYYSVGVEGFYTFVLRDNAGALHRQMVTPDIFEQYAIGDYFNDQQVGPGQPPDYKNDRMTPAEPMTSPEPVPILRRVSQRSTPTFNLRRAAKSPAQPSPLPLAKKKASSQRHVAAHTKKAHPAKHKVATRMKSKKHHTRLAKNSHRKKLKFATRPAHAVPSTAPQQTAASVEPPILAIPRDH